MKAGGNAYGFCVKIWFSSVQSLDRLGRGVSTKDDSTTAHFKMNAF